MAEFLLYALSNLINRGYTITAIILLVLLLAWPAKRSLIKEWLNYSNLLLLLPIGCFLFNYVSSYFSGYRDDRLYTTNPYGLYHWVSLVVSLLLFVLLIFKASRQSVAVTLLALLVINSEKLFLFLTSLYRDYIPSSWSIYTGFEKWNNTLVGFVLLNLLIALLYFSRRPRAGRAVKVN